MNIVIFVKRMRTSSLIIWLIQKYLCASISRDKPKINFLLNIGYVVYVVYVVYIYLFITFVTISLFKSSCVSACATLCWPHI